MIPQTPQTKTYSSWQQAMADAVGSVDELLSLLGLSAHSEALKVKTHNAFPIKVPHSYINKMRYGDSDDPLLRQVLPLQSEDILSAGFLADPVGDHAAKTSSGLLQKYQGRALLLLTGACAIHCRYCFRRHFPYSDNNPIASQWQQTIHQLETDLTIHEVILSGGDPLSLSDSKLTSLIEDIAQIPHIKRLRIHTRQPIVLPERITTELLNLLAETRLNVVMVIHSNHANEIDEITAQVLGQLRLAGVQLLNQAVLLQGVNDNVTSLVNLSERLSDVDVLPYYLHLLDKVQGAQHFDVIESKAIELMTQVRQQLPGYLVPRLVREQQGEPSKTVIF